MTYTKTLLLVILNLSLFLATSTAQETCYDQLLKLVEKEAYEEALSASDECLQQHPNDVNLYETKSIILSKLDRDYDALVCLNEGIKQNPENPAFLMLRANQYYYTGYFDLAIVDNKQALKYVEKDDSLKVEILSNLASAKLSKRDFEGAITDFGSALKIHPKNLGALNNMAAAYNGLGKKEAAIDAYKEALSIDPLFSAALTSLGFLYSESGEYTEALKYIDQSIALEPKEPLNYNNRGFVKYKMGELEAAEKDIDYSLSLYPQNAYAYRNKALIAIEKKNIDQACEMMTQAINYGFTVMYGDEVQALMEEHCK